MIDLDCDFSAVPLSYSEPTIGDGCHDGSPHPIGEDPRTLLF